jgi:HD-like signal output (HDOD) protein
MSASLVSPPAADSHATAARLAEGLSAAGDLPLLPTTAQEALDATRDKDVALGGFARLIEKDVALAATILKLANSPLYSWGRTIDSLEQAVVRLGLRECESLVVAVGMRSLAGRASAAVKAQCQVLWQHSFLVADPMTFEEDDGLLDRERQLLGYDHCTIGAGYAESARMPRTVISAIRHHHRPREATLAPELVELVAAADHLANHFHRDGESGAYEVASNPGFTLMARRLDSDGIDYFEDRVPSLLKEASQVVAGSGIG